MLRTLVSLAFVLPTVACATDGKTVSDGPAEAGASSSTPATHGLDGTGPAAKRDPTGDALPTGSHHPFSAIALPADDRKAIVDGLQAWLDALPSPIELRVEGGELVFDDGPKAHRLQHPDGWEIGLSIADTDAPDADALGASIRYWLIDEVPLPIELDGWAVRLMTPVSSYRDGISVTSWDGDVAEFRMSGSFFALHAQRSGPDCVPPADASMPEACFVHLERNLPFTLVLRTKLRD